MGVRRVLQRDHVLALAAAVAELGDRGRGVLAQALPVGRIDPRARDHPGAVVRADAGLVGLDQLVQCRRVDVAALDQDALQRAHPKLQL